MQLYPLTFHPILKERIWGGTKLQSHLNKAISSETTGESWEISTVSNDVSVVNRGALEGKNLNELIALYPEAILGKPVVARFGKQFPLLFKFIDAKEDLSIQLHPNDELAQKRHNSFGKTEMWYVMQADTNSRLVVGFKNAISKETYLQHLEQKQLLDLLQEYPVQAGDVFFLETGTVHAIGAGVLIAEIQQTSDVTYRIYDWDRVDAEGNSRELHTDLALDAITFKPTNSKISYETKVNEITPVVSCPFFVTQQLVLEGHFHWKQSKDSFTVFMCVSGSFELLYNGEKYVYSKGDTVLLPACITEIQFFGTATLLEIYI
jgi:mannose-6-phosphate isomerase